MSNINVLSEGRPRKLAGRTKDAASLIGIECTFNDGIAPFNSSSISVLPDLPSSSPPMISIGTGESPIERGAERVPTTAIFSTFLFTLVTSACSSAAKADPEINKPAVVVVNASLTA